MWASAKLPLLAVATSLLLGAVPSAAHSDSASKEVTLTKGLTFKWELTDDDTAIEAELVYEGTAWVAFGWNADGKMVGAEAIVGKPADTTDKVAQYHMVGKSDKNDVKKDAQQDLVSSSLVQSGGKTTLKFKRKLNTGDSEDKVLTADADTTCVYAYGSSNTFACHAARGSIDINLATGEAKTSVSAMVVLHGASMTLAWGILAQWGVAMVRFHPSRKEAAPADGKVATWFTLHRNLQAAAVGFALLGFVLAVVMVGTGPHFRGLHEIVGLVVTILAVLQPIGGLLRPEKKDKEGNVTTQRKAFEIGHRSLGALALLLGTLNIIGGSLHFSGGLRALFPAITGVSLLCLGAYVLSSRSRAKDLDV